MGFWVVGGGNYIWLQLVLLTCPVSLDRQLLQVPHYHQPSLQFPRTEEENEGE